MSPRLLTSQKSVSYTPQMELTSNLLSPVLLLTSSMKSWGDNENMRCVRESSSKRDDNLDDKKEGFHFFKLMWEMSPCIFGWNSDIVVFVPFRSSAAGSRDSPPEGTRGAAGRDETLSWWAKLCALKGKYVKWNEITTYPLLADWHCVHRYGLPRQVWCEDLMIHRGVQTWTTERVGKIRTINVRRQKW